jgi:two-component system, LytTR family, response regulator
MAVNTLIVDDEASARSRLRKLLAGFPEISIVGEAHDGIEAVSLIGEMHPDLVLLDVQMPGLDGFEVLRSLPQRTLWPLVIFATAFNQYALDAFEANAVGYLLKPVNRDKLRVAIERACQLIGNPQGVAEEQKRLHEFALKSPGELRHVVAQLRGRFVLIPLEEVFFFRVEDGLTRVKTEIGFFRTDYNMSDLEERLPNPPFFRAHRSAIVNLRKVKEIAPMFKGAYVLIMKDKEGSEIQVSERHSKYVRDLLRR